MTLIVHSHSPAEYAPDISYNHCGRMPWSGRHQSAFTGLELVELLEFCEAEGNRQGRNDANQDRIGTREEAPFHQDFLAGYPKRLWKQAYWKGVNESGDTTPEAIELEVQETLASPETSDWLRTALTGAMSVKPRDTVDEARYLLDVLIRRSNALALYSPEPERPESLF